MPHTECQDLSALFGYRKDGGDEKVLLPPIPKVAPQTGPHMEEPLLYPQGTEPYEWPDNTD